MLRRHGSDAQPVGRGAAADISRMRRDAILGRLGIRPSASAGIHHALEVSLTEAARDADGGIAVLDAGCGRKSPLVPFRDHIARLVGVDVHQPATTPSYLDEFLVADICSPHPSLEPGVFDVILSNFTLEHLEDPPTALANLHAWLRPGGTLVMTTVNRRHPFVAAYLGLPPVVRDRAQVLVKTSREDAHRLVGACNDPVTILAALAGAGFERARIRTYGNLARAWGRHWPTFLVGAAGDLVAQCAPSRRSTIVAVARKPVAGPSDLTHAASPASRWRADVPPAVSPRGACTGSGAAGRRPSRAPCGGTPRSR